MENLKSKSALNIHLAIFLNLQDTVNKEQSYLVYI